jgi:ESCRT-I complex subunit VPS37
LGVYVTETNLALQAPLDQLRSETLAAFANANELKARWAQVEKEQASLYQVSSDFPTPINFSYE